jgi:hypothetical protein
LTKNDKHTTFDEPTSKPRLVSVLEQNSLEEFVQLAQLSKKTFEAERGAMIVTTSMLIP